MSETSAETSEDLNAVVPKATLWKLPSKERVLKVYFLGEQKKWQYKTGILESWMVMKIIEKGWSMPDGVKNGKYVPRFERAFNKNEAQIRVEFKCEAKGGSHSKLGRKAREVRDLDKPTMVLNLNDCLSDDHIESVILHEFGHALGLGHEHQHPEYLDIMKEFFVKDRAMTDCLGISPNVLRDNYKKLNFELVKTDYDPESIMHYPTKIGMLQEKFRHLRTREDVDSDPTTKDLDDKKKEMLKNFLDHLDYIASEPSEKDKSTLAQAYFEEYKMTKEYKDDLKRAPQPVPQAVPEPVPEPAVPKPVVPEPVPEPAVPKLVVPEPVPEPATPAATKPNSEYDKFAAVAPAGKLELILDGENPGVDRHLRRIAGQLDEQMMVTPLGPVLGLTNQEIRDIQRANASNLIKMRMKFLARWKDKTGINATYENLVKALLEIDDKAGAFFVVNLWGTKPKSTYDTYAARAPAGKLEQVLDDQHLSEIARQLDEEMMATDLCPELGLTRREIMNIERANAYSAQQMKMNFLVLWKDKEGINATYGNLVKALLEFDAGGALFVVELWGKPEAQPATQQPAPQPATPVQQPVQPSEQAPQPVPEPVPEPAVPKPVVPEPVPEPAVPKPGKEIELSMRHLSLIKFPGGRFSLRDRVSNKWREIGTNLNIDTNILDTYQHQTLGSYTECWTKVMQSWLDGQGTDEYPKGWDGLYEMLKDVSVAQIAVELKSAVEKASNK